MLGIESVAAAVEAATLIGLILLEAILLYIGYGALERLARPAMRTVLIPDQ